MSQENLSTPMMNVALEIQNKENTALKHKLSQLVQFMGSDNLVNKKSEVKNKIKGTCLCGKETPSPAEACCVEHADFNKYPDLSIIKYKIENYRQNFPELVIRDAQVYLGLTDEQCGTLRNILLARGVNKWMKVRKDLIDCKHSIKKEITTLCNELHKLRIELRNCPRNVNMTKEEFKSWRKIGKKRVEMKFKLKALEETRREIDKMCKSPRYVIWRNSEVVSVEKSGITERQCRICNSKNMATKRHCKTCAEVEKRKWEINTKIK